MKADVDITPSVGVHVFNPLSETPPAGAWQELCDEALDPNPFFGPAFLPPLLKNTGGKHVRLLALIDKTTGQWLMSAPVGRRPVGLLLPIAAAWTTDYSPLGTPLVHPQASDEHLEMFFKAAAGPAGVWSIPFLPLASSTAHRLMSLQNVTVSVTSRFERASHASGIDGERQLENAFKGKRRKEMQRQLRRLEDHGAVSFKSVAGAGTSDRFEAFLDLEASGWKGREGTALKSARGTAAFARSAIASSSRSNSVRIDELCVGDKVIASLVSFITGGWVLTWKIAFDESYARYSPGAQLVLYAFRENLALPGFRQADSLAIPGHSMIEPLWRGRLELGTLLLANRPLGAFKNRLCAADIALERKLRKIAREAMNFRNS